MARIVSTYTETAEGRDKGKKYVITEMSAADGFDWASRLLFAMLNAGVEVSDDVLQSGMAGIAMMGLKAVTKIPHHMAKPLMDELMRCVKVQPEKGDPRDFFDGDIEEVLTIFRIQKAAFDLHTEPFMRGVQSITASTQAATPTPHGG